MYSESDIDGAVAAGAMPPEAARALRDHVAALRATPAVDEESFRLITGFNDIFVSIAIVLTLVAVGWIGGSLGGDGPLGGVLAGALGAAVSWSLAEYFTRQRRMALPSIVLLITFVAGVAAALSSLVLGNMDAVERVVKGMSDSEYVQVAVVSVIAAVIAALTAVAAWLHWRRFMVPITVAAGAVASAAGAIASAAPAAGAAMASAGATSAAGAAAASTAGASVVVVVDSTVVSAFFSPQATTNRATPAIRVAVFSFAIAAMVNSFKVEPWTQDVGSVQSLSPN